MKTTIFLGAGASKADGVPLQNEIFKCFFATRGSNGIENKIRNELGEFFKKFFYLDVNNDELDYNAFPTFEDALGLIDLADIRLETFRDFDLNKIRTMRKQIILMMAKVIHDNLQGDNLFHNKLVMQLDYLDHIKETSFISTNYDILIDNALSNMRRTRLLDYGLDFTNFENSNDWKRPDETAIKLHKIHGSLNWLFCSTCNRPTITPYEKGVIRLMEIHSSKKCNECGTQYEPIIVPPTYYKNMSNHVLSSVWNKCEVELRDTKHLIFCGYSFPEADTHIKYLLKRIQYNNSGLRKITVINHFENKCDKAIEIERARYKRFFGEIVDYRLNTFQDFASNPQKFWE
jgi:NAD-dependent SIR2 family protein deacetylase